jgi:hypothetical protein
MATLDADRNGVAVADRIQSQALRSALPNDHQLTAALDGHAVLIRLIPSALSATRVQG